MKNNLPKVVIVLGPTATGKSDLAVKLSKKNNGEIISADSRQVYKGLDIGSGKITKKEMLGIPHYLIDVKNPKGKRYTVENFKRDGRKAIQKIITQNKIPIICGGTGFYIDALIFEEEFPAVPPNQKLRKNLSKRSNEELMEQIKKLDSERAKTLDPNNKIRIIRAIEIATALGKVPKIKKQEKYNSLWIGLNLAPEKLREKISIRLKKRFKQKMIQEVKRLHNEGVSWKRLYDFGLEYRYISLFLMGKISKIEMFEQLEKEIWHFSKRQMTWFKRNKNIKWFKPDEYKNIENAVKNFIK